MMLHADEAMPRCTFEVKMSKIKAQWGDVNRAQQVHCALELD